jgi:hypothetical protein
MGVSFVFIKYFAKKNVFNKKRLTLKFDSALSNGGQWKPTYFMYFPRAPLEAGLSI